MRVELPRKPEIEASKFPLLCTSLQRKIFPGEGGDVAVSLDFSVSYRYNSLADGIEIPVVLWAGDRHERVFAKLDTGSTYCVFERWCAESLQLDVESGRYQRFRTATGSFAAFEHEVE